MLRLLNKNYFAISKMIDSLLSIHNKRQNSQCNVTLTTAPRSVSCSYMYLNTLGLFDFFIVAGKRILM